MHKTLSSLLFFVLPTVVLFILLNEQIVRLVLGAGKFDWTSTRITAMALLFMSLHMFSQSVIPLYTRSYYAQKNTWYPFYASLFGVIVNAFFAYVLSRRYGVPGLALALSISSLAQLLALVYGPQIKVHYLTAPSVMRTLRQTCYASVVMFFVVYGAMWLVGPALDLFTVRGVLIHFLVPTGAGLLVYATVLKALGSAEYATYEQMASNKIALVIRPNLPHVGTAEEDDIMKQ
jgi:putative peptidoglycan lipid II flippase